MKKFFFAAVLSATSLSVFAAGPEDNGRATFAARQSLQAEYGQVPYNVAWAETRTGMLKASFVQDELPVTVFFDEAGEMFATTVALSVPDLPTKARNAMNQQLKGDKLRELFEISTQSESAYYFRTVSSNKVYKLYANGKLSEVSKMLLH